MPSVVGVTSEPSVIRPSGRAARPHATITTAIPGAIDARNHGGQLLGWLEDALLSLVLTFAVPLAILAVGVPIAFAVRLLIEIGRRWH